MMYLFFTGLTLIEIFIFLLGFDFSYEDICKISGTKTAKNEKNINMLKHIMNVCNIFIGEYIVISGMLFLFDVFKVKYSLIICFVINFCVILFMIFKKLIDFKNIKFNFKSSIFIVLLIGLILPFCWVKSDTINPNSDQGMYGLKAIELMYGDTNNQKELKEYNMLGEEDKTFIDKLQANQDGIYRMDIADGFYYEYHSFPAFPAYMALFGKCFGVTNIIYSLTPIFILLCLNIYFIVKKYGNLKNAEFLAVLLVGFCPVAIYLAKTSLTELIYSFLIVAGINFFISKSKVSYIFSLISFTALGFVHMVTLTYVPLVFFVCAILGIMKKEKIYFLWNTFFNLFYTVALFYSKKVSSVYFSVQLKNMFGENIDVSLWFDIIIFVVFLFSFFNLIFTIFAQKSFFDKVRNVLQKYSVYFFRAAIIFIVLVVIVKGFLLGFTDYYEVGKGGWINRVNYLHKGFYSLRFLNFTNIIVETSYIVVPYIFYCIFKKQKEYKTEFLTFGYIFLYSIAVYTILKMDTPFLYYAARYLFCLIVPISVILFCCVVKNKKVMIATAVICIVTAMPFNIFQLKETQEKGAFNVLADCLNNIEDDSVILMDSGEKGIGFLQYPLREIKNSLVFEIHSIANVLAKFPDKKIYVVSVADDKKSYMKNIFSNEYTFNERNNSFDGFYPTNCPVYKQNLNIFLCNENISAKDVLREPVFEEFYSKELLNDNETFMWSKDVSKCYLYFDESVTHRVVLSHVGLPEYLLDKRDIDVKFKIGEEYVYETKITKENNSLGVIEFEVPDRLVDRTKDLQEIVIETQVWSPSEFGSSDNRELGIPVKNVEVKE